ncbi:MAG: dethiobiotin synthase, partial [Leptospiraceae bacterium]|nr:dethiobiotin synthase [Leptospiraceae bacterium]
CHSSRKCCWTWHKFHNLYTSSRRIMSILITATGTGIGKTFFSILFMLKYGVPKDWYYWKYLETGSVRESDYYCLKKTLRNKNIFPPIYRFSFPASPHYSAKLENKKINIQKLKRELKENLANHKILLEGGWRSFSPINKSFFKYRTLERLASSRNCSNINNPWDHQPYFTYYRSLKK